MSVKDTAVAVADRQAAQQVYNELLTRVGEANPRPRIEPVRRFAQLAGCPETSYPVIQVAGTNGKTSTSRIIESLLRAHGLRTGLFTSPHLIDFTERFQLDGEPVSGTQLLETWQSLQPALTAVDSELLNAGQGAITFFEALTVLAFALFADAPVEVAVIEVGMGGQWDASNIADAQIAVFTPIALDHVGILGNNISEIAATKARILKPGTVAVTAVQADAAHKQLAEYADVVGATLHQVGQNFRLTSDTQAVGGRVITVDSHYTAATYPDVLVPLLGAHQAENATLALAAVELFLQRPLSQDVVTSGFTLARSPGRLQVIGNRPPVVVDAAHNPHGAAALLTAFTENFSFPAGVCVVSGVLADKDSDAVLATLAQLANKLILVPIASPRSLSGEQLMQHAAKLRTQFPERDFEVTVAPDSATGFAQARNWAAQAKRGVLIAGSVLLAGEALAQAQNEGWQ